MTVARRTATPMPPMSVEEFREWADRQPGKWELVDGYPRAMAPASVTHVFIQFRAAYLIERHLENMGGRCRAATDLPVLPSSYKQHNARVPDVAVTCSPPEADEWASRDPVFLMEVLSPTNERDTRDNVWAYMSIPTVAQILLVDSTAVRGEMMRRRPDGAWPEEPELLGPDDEVSIDAVGFRCRLRDFYARTRLAG